MLKGKLIGLNVSIIDKTIIEDLSFLSDYVSATLGTKESAVCASILDYKITGDDSLVINENGFNIQWQQIEFGDETITVIRNRNKTIYKVSQ